MSVDRDLSPSERVCRALGCYPETMDEAMSLLEQCLLDPTCARWRMVGVVDIAVSLWQKERSAWLKS